MFYFKHRLSLSNASPPTRKVASNNKKMNCKRETQEEKILLLYKEIFLFVSLFFLLLVKSVTLMGEEILQLGLYISLKCVSPCLPVCDNMYLWSKFIDEKNLTYDWVNATVENGVPGVSIWPVLLAPNCVWFKTHSNPLKFLLPTF